MSVEMGREDKTGTVKELNWDGCSLWMRWLTGEKGERERECEWERVIKTVGDKNQWLDQKAKHLEMKYSLML